MLAIALQLVAFPSVAVGHQEHMHGLIILRVTPAFTDGGKNTWF